MNQQHNTPSEAQLAANRANAQHSTGPRTETGRATSAQNHTTHGLARHNGAFLILATEDHNGFEALKAGLVAENQPTTEIEIILLNTMAESHWLANRAQTLQNTCIDLVTGQITDTKMFSLYLRYQTTHSRAFHKALNDLLKLTAERRKTEIGFEAQKRQDEAQAMKKQSHELKMLGQIAVNTAQRMKAAKQNSGFEAQYAAEVAKQGFAPPSSPA
jgi:hypothetical protein